jgi:hypothetical protein
MYFFFIYLFFYFFLNFYFIKDFLVIGTLIIFNNLSENIIQIKNLRSILSIEW